MTVPLWAALLMGIGSPALTLIGVLFGQRLVRRNAEELERRSRREEAMRTMRWAAEQAGSDNPVLAIVGVATLRELARSPELEGVEKGLIDAALDSVISKRDDQLSTIEAEGDELVVVEKPSLPPGSTLDEGTPREDHHG